MEGTYGPCCSFDIAPGSARRRRIRRPRGCATVRSVRPSGIDRTVTTTRRLTWSDFGWLKAAEEDFFQISSVRGVHRSLPTLAPTLAAQMLFGRGPAAPALSFTLRLILFAVAERGRTFKDELSSAPKKNAKEFAAWRARVLRSGGAAAAVFEQLAAAGHDIPVTEKEWQRVGKKYGTSSEGGRNWGRDKHNVKAVRKQLMEQTES